MALQDPEIQGPQHAHRRGPAAGSRRRRWCCGRRRTRPARSTEAERITSLIPDARLAVMENCGHWPQYEDTETFNRIHLDFLLGTTEKTD